MKYLAPLALSLALAACQTAEPRIVTRDVNIAVPIRCAPHIAPPPAHIMTPAELAAALARAPNVTERARIVSDQLLLWLGYDPQLEAGLQACAGAK